MSRIKLVFAVACAVVAGLWLVNHPESLLPQAFMPWRAAFMQFSGVLAIAAMSFSMVLATRWRWLEGKLHGLDKMYRLHKWLGIGALVASVSHWAGKESPGWLSDLGLITLPPRGPRPVAGADQGTLDAVLHSLHGPAEFLGEWGFYISAALIAVALVKLVPYHLFAKTHKVLPVIFLALAFHSAVLLNPADWLTPLGLVTSALLVAGSAAAITLLWRMVAGRTARAGAVVATQVFDSLQVLRTVVRVPDGWPGHQPGQFAFVTGPGRDGAHPFTIASAWPGDGTLTFITKALGNYTRTMAQGWTAGTPVTVDGPYGDFTFNDDHLLQIWIGGGIGITPFVARLQHLAVAPRRDQQVVLVHTTAEENEQALALLRADAARAGVTLHILIDRKDGYLSGARLRHMVPDWQQASIWFCGPAGFGSAIHRDMVANGLAESDFHQELFDMR